MAECSSVRWSLIVVSSLFMLLTSALVLSNGLDEMSVLLALRVSSLTTALSFFLIFAMRPLQRLSLTSKTGQWTELHHLDLWVIAAISHLIHLAQIGLYYTLGQSCPILVWAVTLPLWIIVVGFAGIAVVNPRWFATPRSQDAQLSRTHNLSNGLYTFGSWYVWFVFTVAFSLGAATQHLLFYNLPAAILFIAAALLRLRPQKLVSAH